MSSWGKRQRSHPCQQDQCWGYEHYCSCLNLTRPTESTRGHLFWWSFFKARRISRLKWSLNSKCSLQIQDITLTAKQSSSAFHNSTEQLFSLTYSLNSAYHHFAWIYIWSFSFSAFFQVLGLLITIFEDNREKQFFAAINSPFLQTSCFQHVFLQGLSRWL